MFSNSCVSKSVVSFPQAMFRRKYEALDTLCDEFPDSATTWQKHNIAVLAFQQMCDQVCLQGANGRK